MKTLAIVLLATLQALATYHARQYSWGFENGNLIANWSFEDRSHTWLEISPGVSTRFNPGQDSKSAHSGGFVAKVDIDNGSGLGYVNSLATTLLELKPDTTYTLSFYMMANGIQGKNFLAVNLFSLKDESVLSNQVLGPDYVNAAGWTLHRFSFTTGVGEGYAKIYLYNVEAGGKGTVYFDDVVLEEGNVSSSDIVERRRRITEAVHFGDGLGRALQSHHKIGLDPQRKYLVGGATFDEQQRPHRHPSTYVLSSPASPGFQTDVIAGANAYYNGIQAPDAQRSAFLEVEYAAEPGDRVIKSGSQGDPWKISGPRPLKSGYYLVSDLNIPTDIENFAPTSSTEYSLNWSRDANQNYSLSWKNRVGEVVQTAVNSKPDISLPANWSVTKYEYYPGGRLKRILTPLDVNSNTDNFRQVSNYDSRGQLTSSYTQDRGLIKFWYGLLGQLRFSQNEEQRLMDEYTYQDYDAHGRLISVGSQILPGFSQAMADKDSEGIIGQGGKVERVGYIYDDLATFQQRTGVALGEVFLNGAGVSSASNRLVCQYHTNVDVGDIGFAAKDRLVADFYAFDEKGRVVRQFKYIGPQIGSQKLQGMSYSYDILNRPLSSVLFRSVSSQDTAVLHAYRYDELGRVSEVRGKNGAYVARYAYLDRGPLGSVRLGGDAQENTGVRVEYQYHVQGWIKEIKATQLSTGDEVFRQNLGYEAKALADAGVPDPFQARYGGQIAQQLYKLTSDVKDPVRLMNYTYDALGRMTGSDYKKNAGQTPLGAHQGYLFPLSLSESADLDAFLDYDLNGRITGKRAGGVSSSDSAIYVYNSNSYTLDHITGKVTPDGTRDMSSPGTFDYDIRGALVQDLSKRLTIRYGLDLMPTRFDIATDGGHTLSQLQFYDATGSRVSRVTVRRLTAGAPNFLVGVSETGEAPDLYDYGELRTAYMAAQAQLNALPEANLPDTVRFYVVPLAGIEMVEPSPGDIEAIFTHGRYVPLDLIGVHKFGTEYQALMQSRSTGKRIAASHYVLYSGKDIREIHEEYDSEGQATKRDTLEGLFGRGTKIGRILPGGKFQFYVKNHQGSTVRTVSGNGEYAEGQVYDYGIYGVLKRLRENDGITVTEKWTGKELEELTALYYFGARYYDPELGLWLSPDPAGQFFNPYAYGGDPVNYVDPNGEWIHLAVGAVIGAGVGAYTAYQRDYDLTDWQTYAYIGGGAAIGVGVAATGGAIAGMAGTGASAGATIGYGAAAGAVSGAGGGAANYTLSYGIETQGSFDGYGSSQSMGALWQSTWTGAVAGGAGGAAGGYLGNASWNLLGRGGAALGGGFAGGFTGGLLNRQSIGDAALGGLAGAGLSYAGAALQHALTPSSYEAAGGISGSNPKEGDAVVFGPDKRSFFSKFIAAVSLEDYSHAGQIIRQDGQLKLREAQAGGSGPLEQATDLAKFDQRAYRTVGQGSGANTKYMPVKSGYNLCTANCATQAASWTGLQSANNPGVFHRINTGQGFYVQPWWAY